MTRIQTIKDSSTLATGYFTAWDWDFGDGSVSTNNTPQYQFQSSGQQSVKLKVTTDGGCKDSLTKNITVYHLPVSVFDAPPNCENLPVNYIQNSTSQSGSITQYNWSFGDGGTSLSSGPIHVYNSPGIYSVILEVTTQFGCKEESRLAHPPQIEPRHKEKAITFDLDLFQANSENGR